MRLFQKCSGAFFPLSLSLAKSKGMALAGVVLLAGCGASEPDTSGGPATFRRLSEEQFQRSIDSIFGDGIKIPGRFDPPRREDGLLAVGNSRVVISRAGFEQAELRARAIAEQVFSEKRRERLPACVADVSATWDESCAAEVLGEYGRLLYRRPLAEQELGSVLASAKAAAQLSPRFTDSLSAGLSRLLMSPDFLFRVERRDENDPTRLDDYSLASRISFLLWNAPPNAEVLDAVAKGAMRNEKALSQLVDSMIAAPEFKDGVRSFFSDMFGYDLFSVISKEQAIYPIYSSALSEDAKEQALKTLVDHLVTREGDYRDIFTSRHTFLNRRLAALYEVPATESVVEGWASYTFSEDDPRAGLLSQAAFLMQDVTHEGRTSPTIRGQTVRELFLCQKVPPPPPAVDFALLQDTQNENLKTARDRLRVHAEVPTCAGCHAITDPIGLSLENYDAVGAFREAENGELIDASGEFEGHAYHDALELQQVLRDSTAVTDCITRRVYEYGAGRPLNAGEMEWMDYIRTKFAEQQYAFAPLIRSIALSKAFRKLSPDKEQISMTTTTGKES